MAPQRPEKGPEKRDEISGTFLTLLTISLSELRQDATRLLETGWAEPARRRAHELARTLEEACRRQGLTELARLAQSMTSLTRLSREEAVPLLAALRQKFEELVGMAQRVLAKDAKRRTGQSGA